MSSSLSGVQLHHERQATEPRVQRHHVGVSLPRSGCPGVPVLPGVVRPDTLPSDRGMYSTYMYTANAKKAKSNAMPRSDVSFTHFFIFGWFFSLRRALLLTCRFRCTFLVGLLTRQTSFNFIATKKWVKNMQEDICNYTVRSLKSTLTLASDILQWNIGQRVN